MGRPDYDLIPAAILYSHPKGLTREEFGEVLQQTYYYPRVRIEEHLKNRGERISNWSGLEQELNGVVYKAQPCASVDPLFIAAHALYLPEINKSLISPSISSDKPVLFVNGEEVISNFGNIDRSWLGVSRLPAHALVHQDTLFHGMFPTSLDYSKISMFFNGSQISDLKIQKSDRIFYGKNLLDFLKEANISIPLPLGSYSDNLFIRIRPFDAPLFNENIHAIELYEVRFNSMIFESLDSFYKKFPQLHVDERFDWSKDQGIFSEQRTSKDVYFWRKTNNRYFFDFSSLDNVDAGFGGYTDLVLTAEAIKNKAWKIFSWSALTPSFISCFLEDFPDAKLVYDQAVRDSHYSLYAKSRGLSYQDLLRIRATNPCLEDLAEPLL